MRGEYWFNSEPISKHVDIIFEYDEYQMINDLVQLCAIDELKTIVSNIRECVQKNDPYAFRKEYCYLRVDFGLCTVELEFPNHSYVCHIEGDDIADIFERYVYMYEHLDDWFKSL